MINFVTANPNHKCKFNFDNNCVSQSGIPVLEVEGQCSSGYHMVTDGQLAFPAYTELYLPMPSIYHTTLCWGKQIILAQVKYHTILKCFLLFLSSIVCSLSPGSTELSQMSCYLFRLKTYNVIQFFKQKMWHLILKCGWLFK